MAANFALTKSLFGIFATPLKDMIAPGNPIRVLNAFVDSLDIEMAIIRTANYPLKSMPILCVNALLKALKGRFLPFFVPRRSEERLVGVRLQPVLGGARGGLVQNQNSA